MNIKYCRSFGFRAGFFSAFASIALAGAGARAGPVTIVYNRPALDRWMYPFSGRPGLEQRAPTFASLLLPGFDDRDADFLVGYRTAGDVPAGQPASSYVIKSASLRLVVIDDKRFVYDPTFDSVASSYAPTDPQFVPDADAGKPVELFAAGYRNGWTALTFEETSPFGGVPLVEPSEGARNVFPAIFDSGGQAVDVSRQVRQRFEAPPLAIGKTATVAPGELVPADTAFTFDLNLCDPITRRYMQEGLSLGVVNLIASSLHPARGGPGGGTGNYSVYYTKENPVAPVLGFTARFELVVNRGRRSDFNNDGVLDVQDFTAFQNAFALAAPAADMNDDCTLDVLDFVSFQNLFALGQ